MFILKKIISSFLMPVTFSLLILITGLVLLWFTKRQRAGKIFVTLGVCVLLFFSYTAASDHLLGPLEKRYETAAIQLDNRVKSEDMKPVKFIVVLGGGHISDSKLPVTSQVGEATLVRLVEGIRLYRKYTGARLILSGGQVFDPVPEALKMANLAQELGVNEDDILLESESKNTVDEAHLIKPMVNNEPFLLVTSASHMPRAMIIFQHLGMNPIPAPTGHKVKDRQTFDPSLFFPNAENLLKAESGAHEYLGILWLKLGGQR